MILFGIQQLSLTFPIKLVKAAFILYAFIIICHIFLKLPAFLARLL